MAFFTDPPPQNPTLDSWIHHFTTAPSQDADYRAQLRDFLSLGDSNSGTLIGKSINAEQNFLSNIGFGAVRTDLISGAPEETTANDAMTILVEDNGTLKKVERLNFLQNITGAGEINTCSNIGTGEGLFFQKTNQDFEFKGVAGTAGDIEVSASPNTVTWALGANVVKIGGVNDFGQNQQTFHSAFLNLANPADTFKYNIVGAAITDNRAINIPLLLGDDEIVFTDHASTLINKGINAPDNTITNIGDAEIAAHESTKITITNKGLLNAAILYSDTNNDLGAHYLDFQPIGQPAAPTTGVRLYRDDVTNQLTVKDDSGVPVSLEASGANPVQNAILAADETFTDQTDYAIVAGFNIPVGANTKYTFSLFLSILPQGTAIQWRMSGPTGTTGSFSMNATVTDWGFNSNIPLTQASGNRSQIAIGTMVTAASPGNVSIQVRHTGTPSGDTISVRANSMLQIVKETV